MMGLVVADLVAKLGLDKSGFDRGMDQTHQSLGQVGQKVAGVGRSMTMGLTLPLAAVGVGAVMASAKFETSMNQVQAASGASATELKSLSDYAKEMGAATVFSAGEAGGAMLELAKSGFTPAQIQGGALKATMDLASAGGLELADAATITSNAMNTFGLAAKDASSIAAALAGGANASSADVSDLALALSQVGPGARTAGLSVQDTVGILSEFADKGIRGADAGTSLKTMLTNLVPSTDKAKATFDKLGISFTNADGSFKSIADISQILQDRMGGLSAEQRTLAMNTMFGSDATRAATVLMQGGAKGLEKYTDATNDQSAAIDMAKARMKGMGGALENLKGSIETAGIAIGDVLAPGVKLAAGAIKDLADGFTGMPDWAQKAAVGLGTLLLALGPVLLVAGKLATALNAIREFRMARQGLSTVSDLLGKGGGAAANVPLNTALGLNTAATEANTLALTGGKGVPPGGGPTTKTPPGGGGPGGGPSPPFGAPSGNNPTKPLTPRPRTFYVDPKGGTTTTKPGGWTPPETPAASRMDILRMAEKIAVPFIVGIGAGELVYRHRPARTPLGEAMARGEMNPRTGPGMTPQRMAELRSGFDGESIARSLRASGDKAGAGFAEGLAHGIGPALQPLQKIRTVAEKLATLRQGFDPGELAKGKKELASFRAMAAKGVPMGPLTHFSERVAAVQRLEKQLAHLRANAARPTHMGRLDATQMINEISRVSAALGGVRGGARTAGDAVINALKGSAGGGGSYRGHFASGMAAGGYVPARPGGTAHTLGEGGEGEWVIPESKMGRGGGVLHIHIGTVVGTDDAAARKFADKVGQVFMQQVRFA